MPIPGQVALYFIEVQIAKLFVAVFFLGLFVWGGGGCMRCICTEQSRGVQGSSSLRKILYFTLPEMQISLIFLGAQIKI